MSPDCSTCTGGSTAVSACLRLTFQSVWVGPQIGATNEGGLRWSQNSLNEHEDVGNPEIYTKTRMRYCYPSVNEDAWDAFKEKFLFEDVNDEDKWYNFSGYGLQIYDHASEECDWPNWSKNSKKDHAKIAVWGEDLGANPDDKVAKWIKVATETPVTGRHLTKTDFLLERNTGWPYPGVGNDGDPDN